jgi:hypothetical protein
MLDRYANVLKLLCVGLAVLLLFRVARGVAQSDPLGHASIPPLPKMAQSSPEEKAAETNASPGKAMGARKNTNAPPLPSGSHFPRQLNPMQMSMGGPRGRAKLPPAIQARIDRIKESEILGPFMRPPPMALMGIADNDVFLRAPNGQTGMVKEGEELGGVKILRIGINRVLVEEDGEKKELTLFDGLGGDSLMPKEADSPTNSAATNAAPTPQPKEIH